MANQDKSFNEKLLSYLQLVVSEGAQGAARGFSGILGQNLTVASPSVRTVNILDIPNLLGGPEKEAVGIYLRAEGDLSGQIMLIIPYEKAFELVDLLLGPMERTSHDLGRLERSALAEVGNMTGTFFLNAVASMTGLSIRPTPPAVIVDMVGAIMDIIVATTGGISEHVILLGTTFTYGDREVEAEFWVIPDTSSLETFTKPN
ncbi:MAG TPA: chemotaxis protein CheC [Anaerolineaceae bacterium]